MINCQLADLYADLNGNKIYFQAIFYKNNFFLYLPLTYKKYFNIAPFYSTVSQKLIIFSDEPFYNLVPLMKIN